MLSRTAPASPPSPQGVTVTRQLMILMPRALLILSVSSAPVCPRGVTVIQMLKIQIASVPLGIFAR